MVQWCGVKNMLVKNAENRGQLEFVSLEEMVPKDHLLRKIDAAVNFKRIYEFVEDLYCEDNGRPSVDPVVLFKIVLIQHIYGIPSLRRTLEEVSMNLAYRWFIGYPLNEAVPHFSTVSCNFKHRFNHGTVEYVFRWVLKAAAEEGYLDTEAIFVDGTHIKASANLKKLATWKWKASHPGPDGGKRTRSRGNAQDFSVVFPVVFLFTNQKPALA